MAVQQIVNIREINQHLSKYIRLLETGNEIVITKRGKPIAKLVPVIESRELSVEQQQALKRLRTQLKKGYHLGGEGIDRETLYGR